MNNTNPETMNIPDLLKMDPKHAHDIAWENRELLPRLGLASGAAGLKVDYTLGILTVRHGTDDTELLRGALPEGGWEAICKAIQGQLVCAQGPMIDGDRKGPVS